MYQKKEDKKGYEQKRRSLWKRKGGMKIGGCTRVTGKWNGGGG